jgi:Mn2+/Fe2+ NRAMP family transporter
MKKTKEAEEGRVITIHDLPKGKKVRKKKKKTEKKKTEGWSFGLAFLAVIISLAIGAGGAVLAALANGEGIRIIRHWPIGVSAFVFSFSTFGFFFGKRETERLYGIFIVISAICIVAELVLMFS